MLLWRRIKFNIKIMKGLYQETPREAKKIFSIL